MASAPPEPAKTTLLRAVASSPFPVSAIKAFTLDKEALKKANIGYTWGYFDNEFLDMEVGEAEAGAIAISELLQKSTDGSIIAEIGEEQVQIRPGYWLELIRTQAKGPKSKPGPLLTNGRANIAYLKGKGKKDKRRAVYCRWDSDNLCWSVCANSVDYPCPWNDGNQVLSRGLLKIGA